MLLTTWRRHGATSAARRTPTPAAYHSFHRRLPGYAPTTLREIAVPELTTARCFVKHEAERFGLPSFKILGASWAIYRVLEQRRGQRFGSWSTLDELRAAAAQRVPLTLVCATEGNHGRAVARVAALFSLRAEVYVPAGTAAARIAAIESEGAVVKIVHGDYDESVAAAARAADGDSRCLIADTSWPGYEQIPTWIAEGYRTLFDESRGQLRDLGQTPDAVIVPIGVGSLAMAAVASLRASYPNVRIIGVEPAGADCVTASLRAGRPLTVPGPPRSVMAGLNCGTPSYLAWPVLRDGLDACVVIDDDEIDRTTALMAAQGLQTGATGAAGVCALREVATHDPALFDAMLGPGQTVLALSTESVTDPDRLRTV